MTVRVRILRHFNELAGQSKRRRRHRRTRGGASWHSKRLRFLEQLEPRLLLATWTGGGANDLWSNADNWDTNSVPVDGDDVIIPDVGTATDEVLFDSSVPDSGVTLNSLTSAEPLRITGDTLALNGSGTFSFTSALTLAGGTGISQSNASASIFNQSGGTLSGCGTFTVTDTFYLVERNDGGRRQDGGGQHGDS